MKTLKLVIIFSLFLITFFAGIFVSQSFTVESEYSKYKEELIDEDTEIDKLKEENKKLKSELENLKNKTVTQAEPEKVVQPVSHESVDAIVNATLSKPKLSFVEVLTLYQKYKDAAMSPETKERLEAYNNVSKILNEGYDDDVKGLMSPDNTALQQSSDTHKWNVLAIGWGTKDNGEYAINNVGNNNGKDWGCYNFVSSRNKKFKDFDSLKAFEHKSYFKK